jgi:SAM-dependent methyltransferase
MAMASRARRRGVTLTAGMDDKRFAPAADRNREPILTALRGVLPQTGTVLEVASGTGQHVAHFARALPQLRFLPSEADRSAHASIRAWTQGLENVLPVIELDVTRPGLELPELAAIFNANMIHISPWESCVGLMQCASAWLASDGPLLIYGPFRIGGHHTAASNLAFDASLRAQDSRWGVRDLEAVSELAAAHGLRFEERVPMPSNNQLLIFRSNRV